MNHGLLAMQTTAVDSPPSPSGFLPVVPVRRIPQACSGSSEALGYPYLPSAEPSTLHLVVGEMDAWLVLDGTTVRLQFDSAAMRHRGAVDRMSCSVERSV